MVGNFSKYQTGNSNERLRGSKHGEVGRTGKPGQGFRTLSHLPDDEVCRAGDGLLRGWYQVGIVCVRVYVWFSVLVISFT